MQRAGQKTKIVATIGPASASPEKLRALIDAGMDVTRLNFSHGDPPYHATLINRIREAAKAAGARVAIMGDLPGPKMRIGKLATEPLEILPGARFTLTTEDIVGDASRVSLPFDGLPSAVKPGDHLYINDGFILLEVESVVGPDIHCRVQVGGELRSHKGLNFPGIDLGISAFTEEDHAWLRFAATHGVDAVSQSFVAGADDIHALRRAADALGYKPFIIAKIERACVLDKIEQVLEASDGVMVARGDLGVEIPIERIAVVQKQITDLANRHGKPVITATQMLESMVSFPRPTRAEATDVANAILGGTDCIMLSGESAMGRYPVEAVTMLARIATEVEPERVIPPLRRLSGAIRTEARGLIATSVYHTIQHGAPQAIAVPTDSGHMARDIARFRPPVWIVAFSPNEATCQALQFSYGVHPVLVDTPPLSWPRFVRSWLAENGVRQGIALLTQGPNDQDPCANHRLEILELDGDTACP
jgi:pyruvate kinase